MFVCLFQGFTLLPEEEVNVKFAVQQAKKAKHQQKLLKKRGRKRKAADDAKAAENLKMQRRMEQQGKIGSLLHLILKWINSSFALLLRYF